MQLKHKPSQVGLAIKGEERETKEIIQISSIFGIKMRLIKH